MANRTPTNGPHGDIHVTLMITELPLTFHGVLLYSQPNPEKRSRERREKKPVSKCAMDQGVSGRQAHLGLAVNNNNTT